ncbi:helix-turn-helix domain-containing protein [Winkia sp. UMB10116]|uniref:helix-turn-helix domain-containing protein n=1 Tax=Winkia sp. UMB10116 TaxID=3046355 RepID=UPI0025534FCF|nr:helix-turn-helix domain-containing protein [Winkia sp. UMB10116]MDK6241380.1 helix-turn-helix domain-containing protein [Winkia sp. UMB10116]
MNSYDIPGEGSTGYAAIPRWVERDIKLSAKARSVLLALASRANAQGYSYPSVAVLASNAGCSKNGVRRALEELRERGLVSWQTRPVEGDRNAPNLYSVHFDYRRGGVAPAGGGSQNQGGGSHIGTQWVPGWDPVGAILGQEVTPIEVTPVKELIPIPPKGGSGRAPKNAYTEDFANFWQAYPRKTGKKAAAKAYAKAIKEGATPEELLQGAARLAADPNRVDQYTPHPATWLNQGRWEDETPLPARAPASAAERRTQAQQQIWDWATSPEPLPQTCQAGKLTYEQAMAQVEAAERKQVTGG